AGAGAAPGASATPPTRPRRALAAPPAPAPAPRRQPHGSRPVDVDALARRFPYVSMRDRLRRCVRCVLPDTTPFVDFDDAGVCAYCRRHRPVEVHDHDALERLAAPYRRADGRPDCVVGVSGGRDSVFGLYYLKRHLGMNPVA